MLRPYQHTIGIDARMLGAEQTGIGKYIARLCEYLPPLMSDTRFVLFLREPEYSNFKSAHPNVVKRRAEAHWYGYKEQLILPIGFLLARPDLMHFPHFNVPMLYPGKFIVTIHDLTPHTFSGPAAHSWWRKSMFRLVFSGALERSERIIAVSQYTKKDIIERFRTVPEKIGVIYEGVDERFKKKVPRMQSLEFLKKTYGIAKPFLLYVGVWREHKNLAGLIEAYALMLKKYHADFDLVLCGKEHSSYPDARRAWERLGLEDRVKRPGFIPEKELEHFYRAASLTVVPSFAEGFGFTGLESLACQTPVAASQTTSLPEILKDAAVYFDPHNSENMAEVMHRILVNKEEQKICLEKVPDLMEQYRWETMAEKTAKYYRSILEH
ncbi:MAG: glycosyltransferase family 1 protein [bacterium]|nr:glycosyltransferase family 1 protein [bacterium]